MNNRGGNFDGRRSALIIGAAAPASFHSFREQHEPPCRRLT